MHTHYHRRHYIIQGIILLLFSFPCGPAAQQPRIASWDLPDFARKSARYIEPAALDREFLADCIIYQTNLARLQHDAGECSYDRRLTEAAASHSREMVRMQYFSHESPLKKNRTLGHRLKNAGIFLPGTAFAENLGVDFILSLSEVPYYTETHRKRTYYYNYETKEKISSQTYGQFAEQMVKNWLASPGHRRNLLNKKFTRIGIGVETGRYRGHDAVYVTQNFLGPLQPQPHNDTADHIIHNQKRDLK